MTRTIHGYEAMQALGCGILGAMVDNVPSYRKDIWALEECCPFTKKDKHENTSSKALVMAHVYSSVLMDKIEEVVKNGLAGNETEIW